MTEQQADRRHFHRVLMNRRVQIEQNGQQHSAQLLDISLKGALLKIDNDWQPVMDCDANVAISLSEGDDGLIEMEVEIKHIEDDQLGVKTTGIDLESISRLRRLVELNLANSDLLERELRQLIIAQI